MPALRYLHKKDLTWNNLLQLYVTNKLRVGVHHSPDEEHSTGLNIPDQEMNGRSIFTSIGETGMAVALIMTAVAAAASVPDSSVAIKALCITSDI